jgi:ankyrin repeat protein
MNPPTPGNRFLIAVLAVLIVLSCIGVAMMMIRNAQADARLLAVLKQGAGWEKSDFKHEVDRDGYRLNHTFDAQGFSLLDLAAQRGLPDDALLMLLAGANPNIVDAAGRTPIYYALHDPDGRQDMVRDLLILRGARLDVVDPNGISPLMEAVSFGNDKTALALLRFGADPHPPGAQGTKLAALAKRRGFLFAQSLQAYTPGLTRDELGRIPANPAVQAQFVDASRRGDLDAMTSLLRQGAKLDDVGTGLPAISAAVINYQPDAVIYLLHLGADANVVNAENVPPLTYTFGWLGEASDFMQEALIACGARPGILAHHDESLLTIACGRENEHAIQWLIWIGIDPSAPTPQGTPMYLASKEGQDRSVKLLQRNGVTEPPYNDPDPKWQMTHAAKSDNVARIQQLLAQGATVDMPLNGSNDDALMIAIAYRALNVARFLLAHGSNPNYQNLGGDNPLRVSVGWHYDDMEKFREELLDAGANPNLQDNGGQTPFIAACRHGDLAPKITQQLAHGANINQVDHEGHTPLYYAEHSGRTDAADYLRQRGALDSVPPAQ